MRKGKCLKKLLIFDAYGTLISTGKGSLNATKEILSLQNKTIDAVEFYSDWKKYHRKHMDDCNCGIFVPERVIFEKDLEMLYRKYDIDRPYQQDVAIMLASLEGRKIFPEVRDTINKLKKKYRVVIGSTTDTKPLLFNLKENALDVDEVYTSEGIGKYKPAEAFYRYILQSEGYGAEEAVFIGDSLNDDILGPQKVGLTAILVDRENKYDQSEKVKPDHIVSDLNQLLKWEMFENG